LQLLSRTPVTTDNLLAASVTFPDLPFRDQRRARERLQTLAVAGLVRAWSLGQTRGGLKNYYKLTPEGYRVLLGPEATLPHKSYFGPVQPSRLEHTLRLADVIVHTQVAAQRHRIAVTKFFRENELTLKAGPHEQVPDCSFQLAADGRFYNVLFEIDQSTESVDSPAATSIKNKILGYEAYQDAVWQQWRSGGRRGPRPYFRVAFLTRSIDRAYHILALAGRLARNADRHLCLAATQDAYLAQVDALQQPLWLNHHGRWQALVNSHPTARFTRESVRLPLIVESMLTLC